MKLCRARRGKIMTTKWIIDVMEEWAPSEWAMESDNVGLLIGDRARPVSRVLTALDLTESVLREAVQGRFDFVITHHPLITRHIQPINRITADNPFGKKVMTLISNGIGLFCAHTNLDMAPGGVGDLLFDLIGLADKEALIPPKDLNLANNPTLGLVGQLARPMALKALAEHMGKVLGVDCIRYAGAPDTQIKRVGLCGGNGTSPTLIKAALEKKCDVYICGDIDYHLGIDCQERGMALIDGTHYATEIPIAGVIADYIKKAAATCGYELTVQVSQVDGQVFKST